ncbi:hypothetical protein ACOXXX_14430 [Thalassococcus sp. BH17M4-6]|uniref:hypothetical protein n=1 Tax=Thalassococcus sp. BH17M4-6 TaxID=3413148 RepID=UPI003BD879B8
MTQTKTQIGDVTYNASAQAFEALVTFYTDAGRVRVAASYPAALNASFSDINDGLWHNAIRNLDAPDALQARMQAKRTQTARDTRDMPKLPNWLRIFDYHRRAA